MADAPDLKSVGEIRLGSSPSSPTIKLLLFLSTEKQSLEELGLFNSLEEAWEKAKEIAQERNYSLRDFITMELE